MGKAPSIGRGQKKEWPANKRKEGKGGICNYELSIRSFTERANHDLKGNVDECARPENNFCTGGCVNTPGSFNCLFLTRRKKSKIAMIEGGKEEITRVANLAKRCLNLSGRKRPTMREVTMELEGIRIPNGGSTIDELAEEGEYDIIELIVHSETSSTSRSSLQQSFS
ncbi:hypothetical protein LguiB_005984 [Lonicera macranthoides]